MNWTALGNGSRADAGMMRKPSFVEEAFAGVTRKPSFGEAVQEHRSRTSSHRGLSDITNVTAQGLGQRGMNKRPFLEPKTPARRSVLRSNSGFAVFEDVPEEAQSVTKQSSPPQLLPKGRGSDRDCLMGGNDQMLEIEELGGGEPPPIQDFANRVSEQDQYWHALGFEDGPDGFGRPEDLAHALSQGSARACFETESIDALWDTDFGSSSGAYPDSLSNCNGLESEPGFSAFGVSTSPLLPPLDIEMDIDSGSDGDVHGN